MNRRVFLTTAAMTPILASAFESVRAQTAGARLLYVGTYTNNAQASRGIYAWRFDASTGKVTSLGRGFRYPPYWSPDSRKVAFIDQAMRIRIFDTATNRATEIDQSPDWISHPGLESFRMQWSPDSRWLTYARSTKAGNSAVFLYDTRSAKLHQATTGYLNDTQPTFEPEGKYLIYASDREFDPVYGSFDNTWTYPNPTKLIAVPLRRDVKSPLAARNDDENAALDTAAKKEEPKKPEEKKPEEKPAEKPLPPVDATKTHEFRP